MQAMFICADVSHKTHGTCQHVIPIIVHGQSLPPLQAVYRLHCTYIVLLYRIHNMNIAIIVMEGHFYIQSISII